MKYFFSQFSLQVVFILFQLIQKDRKNFKSKKKEIDAQNKTKKLSMVKIEEFKIVLEDAENIYYPGDEILGFVFIKVGERFKINAIKLVIDGSALVTWYYTF